MWKIEWVQTRHWKIVNVVIDNVAYPIYESPQNWYSVFYTVLEWDRKVYLPDYVASMEKFKQHWQPIE